MKNVTVTMPLEEFRKMEVQLSALGEEQDNTAILVNQLIENNKELVSESKLKYVRTVSLHGQSYHKVYRNFKEFQDSEDLEKRINHLQWANDNAKEQVKDLQSKLEGYISQHKTDKEIIKVGEVMVAKATEKISSMHAMLSILVNNKRTARRISDDLKNKINQILKS